MTYLLSWLVGIPIFFLAIWGTGKYKQTEAPEAFILAFFWPIILVIKITISLLEL